MNISELKASLSRYPKHTVRFALPTGSRIPPHAHVTEVAQIDKKFVDCGGTFRTDSGCGLQTWVPDATGHRLTAGKLFGIWEKARGLIKDDGLEVEIEHEAPFISQFPIVEVKPEGDSLVLALGGKHTDCLAKDRCLPPKQIQTGFKPLPALQQTACCASR